MTTFEIRPAVSRSAVSAGWLAQAALLAAGLGWIGGTYPWPLVGTFGLVTISIVHLVPVLVVVCAVAFLDNPTRARLGRTTLVAVACLAKVFTVEAIVWALTHPDGLGLDTLTDWVPIGLANAGGGLCLLQAIRSRMQNCGHQDAV
ncbi:MAG: hypothetical protein ABI137_09380 [Antricoccus sp.]